MRIATVLFPLVSLLALAGSASAGTATSTDEARHLAGSVQHHARMTTMPAPAMLPAVPSSTDDFRALAGARQTTARPVPATTATPASLRVTSTDEARAAAGRDLYTPATRVMVRATGLTTPDAAMR